MFFGKNGLDKGTKEMKQKQNLMNNLFIGALLYRSVPYLLNVVMLVVTQKPVHKLVNCILNHSGILILLLFALALWKSVGYERKRDALSGAVMLGLAGAVSSVGGTLLSDTILMYLSGQPIIYYLLCILLQLGYITLIRFALPNRKNGTKDVCVDYGICIAGSMVLWIVDGLLGLFSGIIQMSFGTNIVLRAVRAMVDAGILYLLLRNEKAAEPLQEDLAEPKQEPVLEEKDMPEAVVLKSGKVGVRLGIACLGIVFCLVLETVIMTEQPEKGIHANIAEDIALGSMELVSGNVEMAAMHYNSAWERKKMWEYVAGVTDNAEVFHKASSSSLLEVRLLYWLYNENISAMEKCLMEEQVGLDFAIELLDLYATHEGSLSERSRAIRKDIISLMIASDTFTDTVISPKDLEGRRYKLGERLDAMEDVEIYCDAVNLLAETGRDGGVSREMAERMLTIAEKKPEDINLQYFAVVYGCAYKSDNAVHYDRTLQAGERFVALVEQTEALSFDQQYQSRMMLVDWAMELGQFEKALHYIEEVLELRETEALLLTLAQCQQDLGKTQECVETAERILELNSENYGAIYYCAVGRLKAGDIDGAIDATKKLCMLVQTLEGEARHQAEVMLYDALQYQGFSDVTYNYMIYRKLSEEQRQRIEESEFYAWYLDAMYLCFTKRDYDVALDCIERVLAAEPDLAQANYLKSCIYFGKEDFSMAIKALEDALAVDDTSATAWYALANAYDALGEYEKAYEASAKVDMLLPDTDHLFDPYGIAIHNQWLKERLGAELGIMER